MPEQVTEELPDLRAALFDAQNWCARLVAGVGDEQLAQGTPCAEFDVRALMTHIALVFEKITGFGELGGDPWFGQNLSEDEIQVIRDGLSATYVDGRSPQDRADLLRDQIRVAQAAWTDAVLDQPLQLGWGPVLPGRAVAGIYLMESLAHGWDLATATGQEPEAPFSTAETGLETTLRGLPRQPRGMEHGVPFGPVVESVPDAGPTERLANWTGRISRS